MSWRLMTVVGISCLIFAPFSALAQPSAEVYVFAGDSATVTPTEVIYTEDGESTIIIQSGATVTADSDNDGVAGHPDCEGTCEGGEGYTITNNGTIDADRTGIYSGSGATVTNNGPITSDQSPFLENNTGIHVEANSSVTNNNTVTSVNGEFAIYAGYNSTVINNGTIDAAYSGIYADGSDNPDDGSSVENYGTIISDQRPDSKPRTSLSVGDNSSIYNNGNVTSLFGAVASAGYNSTITNDTNGTMTAENSDVAFSTSDGDEVITNHGTINVDYSEEAAIHMYLGNDQLVNDGTINIDFALHHGIAMGQDDDLVDNDGTIWIGTVGLESFNNNGFGFSFGSGDDTLDNGEKGLIQIDLAGDIGINMGSGEDEVINDGRIELEFIGHHGIALSSGDDYLENSGTIWIGTAGMIDNDSHDDDGNGIAFGRGMDQLNNTEGATIQIDLTGGDFINFGDDDDDDSLFNAGDMIFGRSNDDGIEFSYTYDDLVNLGKISMVNVDDDGINMGAGNDYICNGCEEPDGFMPFRPMPVMLVEEEVEPLFNTEALIKIDYAGGNAIRMGENWEDDDEDYLFNYGTIDIGLTRNHGIAFGPDWDMLYNKGNILIESAGNDGIEFGMGGGVLANDEGALIQIDSANGFAIGFGEETSSEDVIVNLGTIDIGTTGWHAIAMTGDSDYVFNEGLIEIDSSGKNAFAMGIDDDYICNGDFSTMSPQCEMFFGEAMRAAADSDDDDDDYLSDAKIHIKYADTDGINFGFGEDRLENFGTILIDEVGAIGINFEKNNGGSNPETDWLVNHGEAVITIGDTGHHGIAFGGGYDYLMNEGTITIENAGTDSRGDYGANGIAFGWGGATLNNSYNALLQIDAAYADGINFGTEIGDDDHIWNYGTIHIGDVNNNGDNGDVGYGIAMGNGTDRVYNYGTITVDDAYMHGISFATYNEPDSSHDYLYNGESAQIHVKNAEFHGIAMGGGNDEIDNYGSIIIDSAGTSDDWWAHGIALGGGEDVLRNFEGALIEVGFASGSGIHFGTNADNDSFYNDGTVNIENTVDAGVAMSQGDDILENTGTMNIGPTDGKPGIAMGQGSDTLTSSGAMNFTGVETAIEFGGDDSSTNVDTLNLQGTGDFTIDGDVLNAEIVNKDGSGSWTVVGQLDAYNSVTIDAGTLVVQEGMLGGEGQAINGMTIATGATFMGNAWIFGDLNNDGTIVPGNSIGTIEVEGNYIEGPNVTYEVELGDNETSDQILVGGSATLNDATVVNVTIAGYIYNGAVFNIVETTGGLGGTYYNSAYLNYTSPVLVLDYLDSDDQNVRLGAERITYAEAGANGNASSFGEALIELAEGGGEGSEEAGEALGLIDSCETVACINRTIGQLAPEQYPNLLDISRGGFGIYRNAVTGRMGNLHLTHAAQETNLYATTAVYEEGPSQARIPAFENQAMGWSSWGRILGMTGEQDSENGIQGFDFDTYGVSFGFDNKVNDTCAFGLGFGLANSDVSFDSGQDTDMDSYHVGLYGTHSNERYYVDAALLFASNDYDSTRISVLSNARSSTDGTEWGLYLGGGYKMMETDSMYFMPTASIEYANVDIDGFTETGTGLLYDVEDYDANSFVATAGFRWGGKMVSGETRFEPELRLALAHEFGDTDRNVTASFVGTTTTFTIGGVEPDETSILVGVGANFFVKENTTLYVDYDGEFRDGFGGHALSAGFRYNF